MRFKGTKYSLINVSDGHEFEDTGWTLADPESSSPSLIRAEYENKNFNPREDLDGIYRYADWMPVKRMLKHSSAPVTYKSKGLAAFLGLENLYIKTGGVPYYIEQLQQALPNTNIVYDSSKDSHATGDGWRKLPRYYEMRDLLGMHYMD